MRSSGGANPALFRPCLGIRDKTGTAIERIVRVAGRQFGVVTIAQLLDVGFSRDGVMRLVKRGWLHRIHRGVYRVGHIAPSTEASYLAAVFACGDRAYLSGAAAAYLFGLAREPVAPEVTLTRTRRVDGVITHRVRHLSPQDVSRHRGIPITTVPRTLVDLAGSCGSDDLAELCHLAGIKYGVTAERVETVLSRRPNATGAEKLHRIYRGDTRVLLSQLERGFVKLLQGAGLPLPSTNKKFEEGYVDCRWAEQRVTAELDSYRYHHSRHAWEDGYRRRRAARRRGDVFERFSWGDVFEEPESTVEEVRALLAAA